MPKPFNPQDPFENEFSSDDPLGGNNNYDPLSASTARASGAFPSSFYSEYKKNKQSSSNTSDIRNLSKSVNSLQSEISKLTKDHASTRKSYGSTSRSIPNVERHTKQLGNHFNNFKSSVDVFDQSADKILEASSGFNSATDDMSESFKDFEKHSNRMVQKLTSSIASMTRHSVDFGKSAIAFTAKTGWKAGTAPARMVSRGVSGAYKGLADSEYGQSVNDDAHQYASDYKRQIARGLLGGNPVTAYLAAGMLKAGSKPIRVAGHGAAKGARWTGHEAAMVGNKAYHIAGTGVKGAGHMAATPFRMMHNRRLNKKEQKEMAAMMKQSGMNYPVGSFNPAMMQQLPSNKSKKKKAKNGKSLNYTDSGAPVDSNTFFEDVDQKSPLMTNLKQVISESYSGVLSGMFGVSNIKQGIRTVLGYSIPFFGLGYKAELPNIRRTGLLGGIYRALSLIYVHGRFASKEANDLMLQYMQMFKAAHSDIEAVKDFKIKAPLGRSIPQIIGESVGQAVFGKASKKVEDFIRQLISGKGGKTPGTEVKDGSDVTGTSDLVDNIKKVFGEVGEKISGGFGKIDLKGLKDPNTFIGGIYQSIKTAIVAAFSFLKDDLPKTITAIYEHTLGSFSNIKERSQKDRGSSYDIMEKHIVAKGTLANQFMSNKDVAHFIKLREAQKGGKQINPKLMKLAAKKAMKAVGSSDKLSEMYKEGGAGTASKGGFIGVIESILQFIDVSFNTLAQKVYGLKTALTKDISDIEPSKLGFKDKLIRIFQEIVPDIMKTLLFGEKMHMDPGEMSMDIVGHKQGIIGFIIRGIRAINWSIKRGAEGFGTLMSSIKNFGVTLFGNTSTIWKDPEKGLFSKVFDTITNFVYSLKDVAYDFLKVGDRSLRILGNYLFELQAWTFSKGTFGKAAKGKIAGAAAGKVGAGGVGQFGEWIVGRIFSATMMSWNVVQNSFNQVLAQEGDPEINLGVYKLGSKEMFKVKGFKEAFKSRKKEGRNPILNFIHGVGDAMLHVGLAAIQPLWQFLNDTFTDLKTITKTFWGGEYSVDNLKTDLKATKMNVVNLLKTIGDKAVDSAKILTGKDNLSGTQYNKSHGVGENPLGNLQSGADVRGAETPPTHAAFGGSIRKLFGPKGKELPVAGHDPNTTAQSGETVLPTQDPGFMNKFTKAISQAFTESDYAVNMQDYVKGIFTLLSDGTGGKGGGKEGILKKLLGATIGISATIIKSPFKIVEGLAKSGFVTALVKGMGGIIKTYIWAKYELMIAGIKLLTTTVSALSKVITKPLGLLCDGVSAIGRGVGALVKGTLKGVRGIFGGLYGAATKPFLWAKNKIIEPFASAVAKVAGAISSKIKHMQGKYVVAIDHDNNPVYEIWPGKIISLLTGIYRNTKKAKKSEFDDINKVEEGKKTGGSILGGLANIGSDIKNLTVEACGALAGGGLIQLASKVALPVALVGMSAAVGVGIGSWLGNALLKGKREGDKEAAEQKKEVEKKDYSRFTTKVKFDYAKENLEKTSKDTTNPISAKAAEALKSLKPEDFKKQAEEKADIEIKKDVEKMGSGAAYAGSFLQQKKKNLVAQYQEEMYQAALIKKAEDLGINLNSLSKEEQSKKVGDAASDVENARQGSITKLEELQKNTKMWDPTSWKVQEKADLQADIDKKGSIIGSYGKDKFTGPKTLPAPPSDNKSVASGGSQGSSSGSTGSKSGSTNPSKFQPATDIPNFGDSFNQKVISVADYVGCTPADLLSVMKFESGINPQAKNPGSSATGLIQFMEPTAVSLGTTTAALKAMDANQQMDYVAKYFADSKGKLKDTGDLYLKVLTGSTGIGKPDDYPIWKKGSAAYNANSALDWDKDGIITRGEAIKRVKEISAAGFSGTEYEKLAKKVGGTDSTGNPASPTDPTSPSPTNLPTDVPGAITDKSQIAKASDNTNLGNMIKDSTSGVKPAVSDFAKAFKAKNQEILAKNNDSRANMDTVAESQTSSDAAGKMLMANYTGKTVNSAADRITSSVDKASDKTISGLGLLANNPTTIINNAPTNVSSNSSSRYSDSDYIAELILGPGRAS